MRTTQIDRGLVALHDFLTEVSVPLPIGEAGARDLVSRILTAGFDPTGSAQHSRSTDPETSRNGYRELSATSEAFEVLRRFAEQPLGMTAEEAGDQVWRRVSDLLNVYGYLEVLLNEDGSEMTRTSPTTGRQARVHGITAAGRAALARRGL